MYGILFLKKRGERGMTMAQMTKMQQRIYDYIAETIQRQGYPPSVREIGEAVGLKSPSTVHFHLKHMEELGVLTKGAGKGRALTLAQPSCRQTAFPWWGMWRRAARFWPRSASRII